MRPASRSASSSSPAVEVRDERRDEHRRQRARGQQLEEDVRDGVRRLVRVAEIRRAEHGGDDEDPREADQSRRRGRDAHPGGGAGDPRVTRPCSPLPPLRQLPFGALPDPVVADDRRARDRRARAPRPPSPGCARGRRRSTRARSGPRSIGDPRARRPGPRPRVSSGKASAATSGTPRSSATRAKGSMTRRAGTAAPVPVTSSARVLGPPIRSSGGASAPTPATRHEPRVGERAERVRSAGRRALGEPGRERVPAVAAQRRPTARRRERRAPRPAPGRRPARAATSDPRATRRPAASRRPAGRACTVRLTASSSTPRTATTSAGHVRRGGRSRRTEPSRWRSSARSSCGAELVVLRRAVASAFASTVSIRFWSVSTVGCPSDRRSP